MMTGHGPKAAETFAPEHHAVMFGLLAKGVCGHFGPAADALLQRAVQRYGEQRGARMALRCLSNGDPLDMASYFAYCEWSHRGGAQKTDPDPDCSYLSYRMLACPWHTAWKQSGLLAYGRYYCRFVDRAILRGFSPVLVLEVPTWLSEHESEGCRFHWKSAENTQAFLARQRAVAARLDGSQIRDFCYHTAHLYAVFAECMGKQHASLAAVVEREARKGFAKRYGQPMLALVLAAAGQDFCAI